MHSKQWLVVGEETFPTYEEVAQGSVLSPLLFNVYLEEIIQRCPTLKTMVAERRLLAYADDMVWIGRTLLEIQTATQEFNGLKEMTRARISIKKSTLLG